MFDDIWQAFQHGEFATVLNLAVQRIIETQTLDRLHVAGLTAMQLKRVDEGIALLRAVVTFRPNVAAFYSNAAHAAQNYCLPDDLEYFTRLGLEQFPDDASLWEMLGNVFLLRMDYASAIAYYQAVLAIDPTNLKTRINLANSFRFIGDFVQAEQQFDEVAKIEPLNRDLRLGRAAMLGELSRPDEAIPLLLGLDDADAHSMLALFLLGNGNFEDGWRYHQDRWDSMCYRHTPRPPRGFQHLSQIKGQRVAVFREGGFGDLFQFIRYVPMLAEIASDVLLVVTPSERALLRDNLPANVVLQLAANGEKLAEVKDIWRWTIGLLDLPHVFETRLDTVPAKVPYIAVQPAEIAARPLLPSSGKRRVGVVWAGGSAGGLNDRSYDHRRSVPAALLAEWAHSEIDFISLQHGARAADETALPLRHIPLKDWLDTAAVIAQLDLVISVDTAVAHLAGAMACPTWLLSRSDPCWRWLRNRTDSPWYPTMRVFGQKRFGDWSDTLVEVKIALNDWLKK